MHPHITLPDLQSTAPLTGHPSMRTFSLQVFLELGWSERNTTFIGTRRHANHGTVVGLRRDLIHEIEGATQLAGLRIQWSWGSNFLNSRPHRAPKVLMRFVGIFKNFNAAPVTYHNSVLALGQVFTEVAFS